MTDSEFRDMAQKAVLAALGSTPPAGADTLALVEDLLSAKRDNNSTYGMSPTGFPSSSATPGCFYLKEVTTEGTGGSPTLTFGNPYYRVAGQVFRLGDNKCKLSISGRTIVALVINSATGSDTHLAAVGSFQSLVAFIQSQPYLSVIPLYEFDDEASVSVDFRNSPVAVQGELPRII